LYEKNGVVFFGMSIIIGSGRTMYVKNDGTLSIDGTILLSRRQ
jgi:ribosomal protein L24E